MRYPTLLATATIFLASAARADLTIHYKTSYQLAEGIPASMTDAMKQQLATSMPADSAVQIHGDQVVSRYGKLICIMDYAKQQITLLHPPSKRYATAPAAEFAKQVASLITPEARQAMEAVKVDVKGAKSGKTAVIDGVPAEEMVINMTMEGAGPTGPGIQMRMEMRHWMATDDALQRLPELKQWDMKKWTSLAGFNPADVMSGALASGPSADKLRAAMQELIKDKTGLLVKSETRIFMPFMAQMLQTQGVALGDGPLISTMMEMDRLSTEPVAASAFEVPAGYQAAPFADLMQEFNPAKPGIPQANRLLEERPPLTGGIYRVGGGVTAPRLKSKVQPSYSEEARSARVQGTVTLYVVVAADGYVRNVRVLKPLDHDLDINAIECVKQWEFEPGMKDGQPVNVEAQVEVNFRLGPPIQQ